MRVLITGANGYIGSSIYEALKNKHEIVTVTRKIVDLADSKQVEKFFSYNERFDVVVHCAVVGGHRLKEDEWSIIDDNLKIYYNLINNQDRFGRFINIGSGAEIFDITKPYGFSKSVIYKSVLATDNRYNIRVFAVFDSNELDTRFIKASIIRYIKKEPIIIHQDKSMDFFYMEDLIKIVDHYIKSENPDKEIDCSYENCWSSLNRIAKMINRLDNHEVDIIIANPSHGYPYVGNYKKIEGIEYIGLEQGIKDTYNKLKGLWIEK